MATCIAKNCKTFKSLDLSSICPRRETGNQCPYCYVETARQIGTCRAKLEYDRIGYRGELLRMKDNTLAMIRRCGGLRIFSFGDYKPWMDQDLEEVVQDARIVRVPLKAITKVPEFVHKFHDKVDVINVSIDTIGYGVPWDVAKGLREKYPNVYIRAAVLAPEDVEKLQWADILTLNHGFNKFHRFSKTEKEAIFALLPEKMCCQTGKCVDCKIKCKGTK